MRRSRQRHSIAAMSLAIDMGIDMGIHIVIGMARSITNS
jgi:hypothetical protein